MQKKKWNKDALVRALAEQERELHACGLKSGKSYAESREPAAFRKLEERFDLRKLKSIIDDPDHPNRPGAIAAELTGHATFLSMIEDEERIDYRSKVFLAGFIAGIDEALNSISYEKLSLLTSQRADEVDLDRGYFRAMNNDDLQSSYGKMCDSPFSKRFSTN